MARTTLAVQTVDIAGDVVTMTAANADGHNVANNGLTYLRVLNSSGAPINVTVQAQANCNQGFAHDAVVAVAAAAEKTIGPFPTKFYNKVDGYMEVDFSAAADVTCAATQ